MRIGFTALAVLSAMSQAACRSGLRTRHVSADAGGGQAGSPDVAAGDSSADLAGADRFVDLSGVDSTADLAVSGTGDAGALGIPKGFRIVNATANTVYVDLGDPVKCRVQDASGWQACDFFGSSSSCPMDCQSVQPGDQCCVYCEQPTPTLLVLPPGGHGVTVDWGGSLFAVRTDYCSDCQCQEQFAVGQGTYEATVRAYDEYTCVWGIPCAEESDGTIPYAAPQGSNQEHAVQFAIPSADDEILITIPAELAAWQVVSGTDALLDAQVTVVGKVLPDIRQKLLSWPDPVLSLYILQDGGDVPGYSVDPPPPFIQLYSASDLSPYLQAQVRVTAYLRSVMVQYFGGEPQPFYYLEVISITAI
jgi:hypothetical protein